VGGERGNRLSISYPSILRALSEKISSFYPVPKPGIGNFPVDAWEGNYSVRKFGSFTTVALAICLLGCTNELEKINIPDRENKQPSLATRDVEVLYSDSGRVRFRMLAPMRLDYQDEISYSEMPNGIQVDFYGENQVVISSLQADFARLNNRDAILFMQGNVIVVNSSGDTLKSPSLVINQQNRTIYSEDHVEIVKSDKRLFGEGFLANSDFSQYRIFNLQGSISFHENP
jgi:LPS export ABC transporter protein LptC